MLNTFFINLGKLINIKKKYKITKEQYLFEYGFDPDDFEISKSTLHGKGLKTKKRIKKGDFVISYFGEKISNEEADRRFNDPKGAFKKKGITYIYYISEKKSIDGVIDENIAKFMNHSCDPCLKPLLCMEKQLIEFTAKRDIEEGEELFWDYEMDLGEDSIECLCGSKSCRKELNYALWKRKNKKLLGNT